MIVDAGGIVLVAVALIAACFAYARHVSYTARVRRAAEMARLAADWESTGQIQRAYREYSAICEGSLRIERADLPPKAYDRVLRLHRRIVAAHDDALRALDAYRERVGRYPDSLEAVQAEIPDESLAAFRGFEYERKGDSDLRIVTGLYDSAIVDLRRRRASAEARSKKGQHASRDASHPRRGASNRTTSPSPAPTQPIH